MKHFVAKSRIAVVTMAIALGTVFGIGLSAPVFAQQPFVDKLVLDDTIQPVSADEVTRSLDRANSDGASALLIEINTPGGLLDSMRDMVGGILRSRVPVIVYVGPSGARAGSAIPPLCMNAATAPPRPPHPCFDFACSRTNAEKPLRRFPPFAFPWYPAARQTQKSDEQRRPRSPEPLRPRPPTPE